MERFKFAHDVQGVDLYHIQRFFFQFVQRDTGAVTVDWVVLCGAVVALGLGVLILVEPSVDQGAGKVAIGIGNSIVPNEDGVIGAGQ